VGKGAGLPVKIFFNDQGKKKGLKSAEVVDDEENRPAGNLFSVMDPDVRF
jgi:hypothetical protein